MLKTEKYLDIIKHTTLTAVDLILIKDNRVLVGLRKNQPAKNMWFTPGVRTYKYETQNDALKRVAGSELGIKINPQNKKLLGVYDHTYNLNFQNDNFGTHYIVNAYLFKMDSNQEIKIDPQHEEFKWMTLEEIEYNHSVHIYVKKYLGQIKKFLKNE